MSVIDIGGPWTQALQRIDGDGELAKQLEERFGTFASRHAAVAECVDSGF